MDSKKIEEMHTEVVLGALLHDIGKLIQRSSENPKEKRHQEWGGKWLEDYPNGVFKDLKGYALYHHKLSKDDYKYDSLSIDTGNQDYIDTYWIVYEADNLASGEREEYDENIDPDILLPLSSIFQNVSLNGNRKPEERSDPWVYKIQPFGNDLIFPVRLSEYSDNRKEHYQNLLKAFEEELKSFTAKELRNPDILLNILHKFTLFVPSYTYYSLESKLPTDISLFHHLKTTAAIASAMFLWHMEKYGKLDESEILNREKEKYLLVGGDISGIQSFIYSIKSFKALKNLRGRSFYLQLLVRHVVNRILDELKLFRVSVIYEGGGGFAMLLPNTETVINKLDNISNGINKWLFDQFEATLSFNIGYLPFSGNDFKNIAQLFTQLFDEVIFEKKLTKFKDVVSLKNFEPEPYNDVCALCNNPNPDKELKGDDEHRPVCKHCKVFVDVIGTLLPTANYVVIDPSENAQFYIQETGYKIINELEATDKPSYYHIIALDSNSPDFLKFQSLQVSRFPAEGEKEFKNLVDKAIGGKYLGTLRMDVDNLGRVFSRGLKNISFGRLSTLSELMGNFFSSGIDLIVDGKIKHAETVLDAIKNEPKNVVVVYAGGDDLFITGAWDDVVILSFKIYNTFRKYTCYNPDLTISGGVVLTPPDYPIYRIACIAGEAEESAKEITDDDGNRTKDRLALLYSPPGLYAQNPELIKKFQCLRWGEWEDLMKKVLLPIYNLYTEENISRSFLMGIYELAKDNLFQRYQDEQDGVMTKPRLAYRFARFLNKESSEKLVDIYDMFLDKDLALSQVLENLRKTWKVFEVLLYLTKQKGGENVTK